MSYLTGAQISFNLGVDMTIKHIEDKIRYAESQQKIDNGKILVLRNVVSEIKLLKYDN